MRFLYLKPNTIFNLKLISLYQDIGIMIKFHLINNAKRLNIPQFIICPEDDCKICKLYQKLIAIDKWYSFKDWMKINFNSNINLKQFEQYYIPIVELTANKKLAHGILQLWPSDTRQLIYFIINNADDKLGKLTDNRILKIITDEKSAINQILINTEAFFMPTNQYIIDNIKKDISQYIENELVFNKQDYQLIIYSLANLIKSFWGQNANK